MVTKGQLRRIIARKGRLDPESGFRTELGEFDPEVYSQDPLSEDDDLDIPEPGDDN